MAERDHGEQLREEIAKWGQRLATAVASTEALGEEGERFLTNIRAYQSDAQHFQGQGDLVRAFEAVVWAWAWLEVGADIGYLDAPALVYE